MKSERWQSSKSMLLSFQYFKVELKTERQWAKAGYLCSILRNGTIGP